MPPLTYKGPIDARIFSTCFFVIFDDRIAGLFCFAFCAGHFALAERSGTRYRSPLSQCVQRDGQFSLNGAAIFHAGGRIDEPRRHYHTAG